MRCSPVDYSRLCKQVVTVYHQSDGAITRTVFKRAFLEFKKTQNVDKVGSREVNSFLLVIPGADVVLRPEDKVLLGCGPELSTMADWRDFIPAKVSGLGVIKYVDPKFWEGQQIHMEAGG